MKSCRQIYEKTNFENLKDMLEGMVAKYPDHIAFKIKDKGIHDASYLEISYTKFKEDIDALKAAFIEKGLKDNKRVAIISPNRYEWVVTYFAIILSGNTVVPLDKGLPALEIESLIKRSYADAIVFAGKYIDTMKEIKDRNETKLEKYICMDKVENIDYLKDYIEEGEKFLKEDASKYDVEMNNDDMRILIFTSGTTSASKAVMLSQRNITSNVNSMMASEKIYDTDVNLAFLPFHHTFGITGLMLYLTSGACNTFCDGLKYIQKNLVEYKISLFVCVPLLIESMYKKIMKEVEKQGKTKKVKTGLKISKFLLKFGIDIRRKMFKDIIDQFGGNLRFIVSGAAGLDPKVAEAFNGFGILTVQGYGLTETSPVLASENEKSIKYGSIGVPLVDVEMKIDNPNENGVGEIIARGPNVMLGYYENKEATKEVLQDGWIHTGDLGYEDKEGFFFVTGRKKNVIVLKNGKNVFPEEIETLITALPYVEENMVFGLPKDDDLLVSVKIVYNKDYIKEKYGDISKEELHEIVWKDIKEINKGLTTYKYIKHLILTDVPMIKTTTAKIKRYEEIKNIIANNE